MESIVFYIDPSDTVDQVKEEIKKADRERIILVIPEENQNLKNIESLTILKKESQKLSKALAIFSTNFQYKRLAEDCGIEIEDSLTGGSFHDGGQASRPKISDIMPRSRASLREAGPVIKLKKAEVPEEKKIEKGTEPTFQETFSERKNDSKNFFGESISNKPTGKTNKKLLPFFYVLIFLGFIGAIIYVLIFLPRADIVITPVSEEIKFSGVLQVKEKEKFDADKKIVPGTIIEKEEKIEKPFSATGSEKRIDKASGKITVYNESSSNVGLILGTRFKSKDSKIFRAQEAISIPGGSKESPGTLEVEVVAEEAGEEYNIEPTTFTVPGLASDFDLKNAIYAKSTEKMIGGFMGEATVVMAEDIEKATEEIKKQINEKEEMIRSDITDELSLGINFLKDEIIVNRSKIIFDKKAGDVAKIFKGQLTITAKVLTFNENDVKKIIANIVSKNIKKGIDFTEVFSSQDIKYEVLDGGIDKEIMEVSFDGSERVAWKINTQEIKDNVAGLPGQEAQAYLENEMKGKIKDGSIKIWPFWVNNIPKKNGRIFIEIKYGSKSESQGVDTDPLRQEE